MGYPRNILGFDMKNDLELKTYKFLMGLGRAKSRILKLVLYDAYPDSVKCEEITTANGKKGVVIPFEDRKRCRGMIASSELVKLVDQFNSKNASRSVDKEISVSWAYNDKEGVQSCIILSALNSGTAGKFIAEQLRKLFTNEMYEKVIPNLFPEVPIKEEKVTIDNIIFKSESNNTVKDEDEKQTKKLTFEERYFGTKSKEKRDTQFDGDDDYDEPQFV